MLYFDNRYDGPLLTKTPQYIFITDFVRPRNVEDLPPKPYLTGLQPLHVFFRQVHNLAPYELLQGKLSNLCFHKLKPY